jgi:hypothetical protein
MGKGFKGETCVYCAAAPAATMDHVFAREFFLADQRANLPKVPACEACNNAKSKLEHYLTAVLPFGGQHADGLAHLTEMVPGRLARNQKLARGLSAGRNPWQGNAGDDHPYRSREGRGAFRADRERAALASLAGLRPETFGVGAEMLSVAGEKFYDDALAMNCRARVSENLGNGTFSYEGAP